MKLESQSPDYILEKYNHWIGFKPVTEFPFYTPDELLIFVSNYYKRWGGKGSEEIRRQLFYLKLTEGMNVLKMVDMFQRYIGPLNMINPHPMKGLHEIMERDFVPAVIEKNKENITIVLRDLKISNLV
jgi:hypothetical protein